ncbi:MAG: GDYXXLXY domain-containing protein [Olleya sp.]
MKTIHLFIIFIIVACIQLFVPSQMIINKEDTLSNGKAYKFKTRPVDPTDPFRGKYITLRFDINSSQTNDSTWVRDDKVYVYLDTDNLGFAKVKSVSKEQLNTHSDYVIAEVRWYNQRTDELNFNLPFNRFYMEESKAKPAEEAYREAQRDTLPNNTYALVYVKEGDAVLKDVLINEIPIGNYIENQKIVK